MSGVCLRILIWSSPDLADFLDAQPLLVTGFEVTSSQCSLVRVANVRPSMVEFVLGLNLKVTYSARKSQNAEMAGKL